MILPLRGSRHCPLALKTVSPPGKRGMISRSTNRLHAPSPTPIRAPILRPNINSATCCGFCAPRHSDDCAPAPLIMARASTEPAAAQMNFLIADSKPLHHSSMSSSAKADDPVNTEGGVDLGHACLDGGYWMPACAGMTSAAVAR